MLISQSCNKRLKVINMSLTPPLLIHVLEQVSKMLQLLIQADTAFILGLCIIHWKCFTASNIHFLS